MYTEEYIRGKTKRMRYEEMRKKILLLGSGELGKEFMVSNLRRHTYNIAAKIRQKSSTHLRFYPANLVSDRKLTKFIQTSEETMFRNRFGIHW